MWIAIVAFVLLISGAMATATRVLAQSNSFSLPWTAISSGGGVKQSPRNFILQDTIGQSIMGRSTSKSFRLATGFQAIAPTQFQPAADLSIAKVDNPDPVVAGEQLTYTVQVANDGPSDASGVKLVDTLPLGTSFISASPPEVSCNQVAGLVTCNIGGLAADDSVNVIIVVDVEIETEGIITNAASVTGNESDPNLVNNTTTEDTTVAFVASPILEVPDLIPAFTGTTVTVPVNLHAGGVDITSLAFSLDFDETNLSFDTTDANADGIPDSVNFLTPGAFTASVFADLADTDGELDFDIHDQSLPAASLPDGAIAEITFTAIGDPGSGNTRTAPVVFSADPAATFGGPDGRDVPGFTEDGSVLISGVLFGDCNGDGTVSSADITAEVLEIFDGDGSDPANASGGTFAGTTGCDSNEDGTIGAADITCVVLIIFNGSGACGQTVGNSISVDEDTGGTLTFQSVPVFSLKVAPGTATFHDGSKDSVLTLTSLEVARPPMITLSISPAEVVFNPPAPITIPNLEGLGPGETLPLFSFNHDIEQLVNIGPGTVSEDGSVVVSDPRFGITQSG